MKKNRLKSITNMLMVTTQICALAWVTVSYGIALYATVKLEQVFPVTELSGQAVEAILGVNVLKTLGNIFEHNEGGLFGKSKNKESEGEIV